MSSSWGLAKKVLRVHTCCISAGRSTSRRADRIQWCPLESPCTAATQMPCYKTCGAYTGRGRDKMTEACKHWWVPAAFAGVCSRRNVYRPVGIKDPLLADAHIARERQFAALPLGTGHVVPYDPQLRPHYDTLWHINRAPVQPNRTRRLTPALQRVFYTLYFATNAKITYARRLSTRVTIIVEECGELCGNVYVYRICYTKESRHKVRYFFFLYFQTVQVGMSKECMHRLVTSPTSSAKCMPASAGVRLAGG